MIWNKTIMLGCVILVASCAGTQGSDTAPILAPPAGKALIVAENDAWGKALIPLQIQKNARFEKLDGKQISSFTNSVETLTLDPGEHTIETSCSFRRGTALQLQGATIHKMNFEADKSYLFKVVITNGACGLEVETSDTHQVLSQ
jgi:hypothetical protein